MQPWNTDKKDELENRLRDLVCEGKIALEKHRKVSPTI
jgi:hypothetical protein